MEWSFEHSGDVDADVVVPAGTVEIDAIPEGGEVAVSLEAAGGTSRRSEELIAGSEVTFSAGKLRVHVPDRFGVVRHVAVRCRITLPEHSTLAVKTASADVACRIPLGAFSGTSASGDVELRDVRGDVSHRSASGDLRCASVGGPLRARSASGNVVVQQAGAKAEVATASGDVAIADAVGSVDVRTASGDVIVGCVHKGKVRAASASGDVVIGVASGVGASLDVTSVSGETTCTLAFEAAAPAVAELAVVCRTVSGDVRVQSATG